MPGRGSFLALTYVALAAVVLPAAPAPAAAAPVPVNRRAAPQCDARADPAKFVAEDPWAQRRYPPDRLAPLATGAGVTVAVIDSGVDVDHPQLRGRVADGTDLLDSGGDGTHDCVYHGTAVASIIAATPRDGVRFHGLAPLATILPVRVSEQQDLDGEQKARNVTQQEFAQAIRWAVNHDADVINLSVVLYEDNPAIRDAIGYALERNVVVVAAAGNRYEKGNPRPYPASYDGVLGVGAIDENGVRASFSQTGPWVDLVAPGVGVLAATAGPGHSKHDGTSYAAPFVAATAALLRQYQPQLSAAEVVARIVASTDPAPDGGRSDAYGSGVLNPYRALTDTRPAGAAPTAAALPVEQGDPVAVAAQQRRDRAGERSLWVAGGAGGLAALALFLAVVLPRGARRGWQPAGRG
ncbi:type VII secretion-associated serine protease mycosin [Micromonospora sp. NBC_01796]|uniref:type VII secretion-associated serine protease mycosin n=1 Tax=Micromonospora sp. NBC_01796 TaxID=2975987 RepID=UPI002DDB8D86|nr:type VII secretion-associated serine protease mycosin [Micromonospora sp. NBC_01796]WSA88110.1 type VII secretion-associated serine protease mycosin [Micromonospora sp. NBC_01796]